MNNNNLVSILINNYNYGCFLAEAIDSALNQTYSNIEIIVVDDGSTDNSSEIIQSYKNKIIPILKQNGGQASAFNTGFAASQGEIICFLDSDDIFLPEKVSEIVSVFAEHDIGWCFNSLKFFNKTNEQLPQIEQTGLSGRYDIRADIKRGKLNNKIPKFNLATSGISIKRSLLEKILPMPEVIKITSDDYIKYTALGLSPGFIILKDLGLQRIHGNNAFTLRVDNEKRRLDANIQILTAYWMNKNFPSIMSQYSNNILAEGISRYWYSGGVELECQKLIKSYLASTTLLKKLEIYLRALYYRLKL